MVVVVLLLLLLVVVVDVLMLLMVPAHKETPWGPVSNFWIDITYLTESEYIQLYIFRPRASEISMCRWDKYVCWLPINIMGDELR